MPMILSPSYTPEASHQQPLLPQSSISRLDRKPWKRPQMRDQGLAAANRRHHPGAGSQHIAHCAQSPSPSTKDGARQFGCPPHNGPENDRRIIAGEILCWHLVFNWFYSPREARIRLEKGAIVSLRSRSTLTMPKTAPPFHRRLRGYPEIDRAIKLTPCRHRGDACISL